MHLESFIFEEQLKIKIISNNIPHAIAAGILYFVAQICKINIGKKDVKNVCGVSEVTINKCYKKLEQERSRLVPQTIIQKYES